MNGAIFERYVETQLTPGLTRGDVVIFDNADFPKRSHAEELVREWRRRVPGPAALFPRSQPDRNAFSKLKALLRKKAARTFDGISDAIANICDPFDPQ